MEYVVYLDIYFFVNFIMDYIVLKIADYFGNCKSTLKRNVMGAGVGAIITSLLYAVWNQYGIRFLVVQYALVVILMNLIAFKTRTIKGVAKMFCVTYFTAFALGGIIYCLYYYTDVGIAIVVLKRTIFYGKKAFYRFIGFSLTSFSILSIVSKIICDTKKKNQKKYKVILMECDAKAYMWGIYDTGNNLRDIVNNEAVHIVSESVFEKIGMLHKDSLMITYSSLGNKDGILQSYRIDKMIVEDDFGNVLADVEKPRIAIANDDFLKGDYQVILNGDLML